MKFLFFQEITVICILSIIDFSMELNILDTDARRAINFDLFFPYQWQQDIVSAFYFEKFHDDSKHQRALVYDSWYI